MAEGVLPGLISESCRGAFRNKQRDQVCLAVRRKARLPVYSQPWAAVGRVVERNVCEPVTQYLYVCARALMRPADA